MQRVEQTVDDKESLDIGEAPRRDARHWRRHHRQGRFKTLLSFSGRTPILERAIRGVL